MSDDIKNIINRLKESIVLSGYSYAELEKKTGISRSSLQRYANGITSKIPIDAIQSIAKAVGVEAEYIMGWENNDNKQNNNQINLTNHENKVITAYRDKPDMQPAVDKLLGVEDEQSEIPLFRHPGELTKYKRQKLGLTQEELAQKLSISASELKQWESYGSYINYNKVSLLANILGVDALDLLPKNDGFFDSVKAADSKSFGNAFGSKNNK